MRTLLATAVVLAALAASVLGAPILSTTIDYLDYAFFDREGGPDYYPLEVWEKRLTELRDCGFRKVNLRVNVCGLTLYPTKVAAQYGQDGRGHFQFSEGRARLIATLAKYDPLAETIRIGHQLGMEVWCWDSLWDDAATYDSTAAPELLAKYGNFPLIDPWHLTHPGCWSRRDPKLDSIRDTPAVDLNRRPVGRIYIVSDMASPNPVRFTRENVTLYVSDDNRSFRQYPGDFQLRTGHTPEGFQFVEFTGLDLRHHYLSIQHDDFPRNAGFSFVLDANLWQKCHIYDTNGQELPAVWAARIDRGANPPDQPLNFNTFPRFAWDWGVYQLSVAIGAGPFPDPGKWLVGVPEFTVPAALEHKVDRFRELAAYPFDGYIYNLRSHSVPLASRPDDYGYNPEVREAFLKRHGVDIYRQPFDREQLHQLRSEAIDALLKRCKELIGSRPFYMTTTDPDRKPNTPIHQADWCHRLGARWHFDQWFRDGSVDGIVMFCDFFPEKLQGRVSNGHPVRRIAFRDRAEQTRTNLDKFRADLQALLADPCLDEVELYEALEMDAPHRAIIRQLLDQTAQ